MLSVRCARCDFECPEGFLFCGRCGSSLPSIPAEPREAFQGERKQATVLFSDLSGYSSLSEKLDPEDVKELMSRIFAVAGDIVDEYGGTVERFFGDEFMALFGVPKACEEGPLRALFAAWEIHRQVKVISTEWEHRTGEPLQMHTGINTGLVITGEERIGNRRHGLTGETINLAKRLTGLAGRDDILVCHETFRRAGGYFSFEVFEPVRVKGKGEAIRIYRADALTGSDTGPFSRSPESPVDRKRFDMIGREEELSILESMARRTRDSFGSVVRLTGEAGIGKSRLIAEFKRTESARELLLLEGRGISTGKHLSYLPFIDLFRHWAKIGKTDDDTAAVKKVTAAVRDACGKEESEISPFLLTMMSMPFEGDSLARVRGIEGEALEKMILKSVRDLLVGMSAKAPLAVVMEDLQWADRSSISLMRYLLQLAGSHSILFINVLRTGCSSSDEMIEAACPENSDAECVEMSLAPLEKEASGRFVGQMLRNMETDQTLRESIVAASGGNPFFMEEIVESLIDREDPARMDTSTSAAAAHTFTVPATVKEALTMRVDQLEDEAKALLKKASVIGRVFPQRLIARVMGGTDSSEDILRHLEKKHLIQKQSYGGEREYFFCHALAQETVYDSILLKERKILHLEIADAIEEVFQGRLSDFHGVLAFHYGKGENREKAEKYLLQAGRESLRASASTEALYYFREGLKLYRLQRGDSADPEQIAVFGKSIADALYNKSLWREAVQHFDEVLENWMVPASPNRAAVVCRFMLNAALVMSGFVSPLLKGKALLRHRDREILELTYKRGTALFFFDVRRSFFQALNSFNRACAVGLSRSPEAVNTAVGTAGVFSISGLSHTFAYKLLELCRSAIESGSDESVIPYTMGITVANACSGRWQESEPFQEETVRKGLGKGDLWNTVNYLAFYTYQNAERGEFETAWDMSNRLLETGSLYNYPLASINAAAVRSDIFLKKGDSREALREAEDGVSMAQRASMDKYQLLFLGFKAESHLRLGEREEAKATLLRGHALCERLKLVPPAFLAPFLIAQFAVDLDLLQSALDGGNENQAAFLLDKARRSGRVVLRKLRNYALHRTKSLWMTAEYYRLAGRERTALKWLKRSIAKGEELGAMPDLARACLDAGKLLANGTGRTAGNRDIGMKFHERGRALMDQMNLSPGSDVNAPPEREGASREKVRPGP